MYLEIFRLKQRFILTAYIQTILLMNIKQTPQYLTRNSCPSFKLGVLLLLIGAIVLAMLSFNEQDNSQVSVGKEIRFYCSIDLAQSDHHDVSTNYQEHSKHAGKRVTCEKANSVNATFSIVCALKTSKQQYKCVLAKIEGNYSKNLSVRSIGKIMEDHEAQNFDVQANNLDKDQQTMGLLEGMNHHELEILLHELSNYINEHPNDQQDLETFASSLMNKLMLHPQKRQLSYQDCPKYLTTTTSHYHCLPYCGSQQCSSCATIDPYFKNQTTYLCLGSASPIQEGDYTLQCCLGSVCRSFSITVNNSLPIFYDALINQTVRAGLIVNYQLPKQQLIAQCAQLFSHLITHRDYQHSTHLLQWLEETRQ
ncbi:hypothetical protein FGO68_gene6268 [Halteria grandinella]|uniref:Uncharacterized protein n=1 Tax=Halteria grandinella TaxID=5974 RepID=A0A8J8SW90_HALGN|nr:hypothetical protein FGO68_gene6268 [Halteria grandinella]